MKGKKVQVCGYYSILFHLFHLWLLALRRPPQDIKSSCAYEFSLTDKGISGRLSFAIGGCQEIINCFVHLHSLRRAKFSLVHYFKQFSFMSGEYEILLAIVLLSWEICVICLYIFLF